DRRDDAQCQKRNVESKLRRNDIDALFAFGQQVEEESAESGMLQHLGDSTIPRAVPATPASVRERDQTCCARWKAEVPVERDVGGLNVYRQRNYGLSWSSHGRTSGSSALQG